MTILEQGINFLNNTCISKQEFYFILASFLIYFKPPLSEEPWNDFKKRVVSGDISIEDALFMSDEEKNPEIFHSKKQILNKDLKIKIDSLCLQMKREIEKNFSSLYKENQPDIICIPDVIKSWDEPTFFPKDYIEKQVMIDTKYTNELTGHPFSWDFVDSVKNKTIKNDYNNMPHTKKMDCKDIIKYMKKELNYLYKTTNIV